MVSPAREGARWELTLGSGADSKGEEYVPEEDQDRIVQDDPHRAQARGVETGAVFGREALPVLERLDYEVRALPPLSTLLASLTLHRRSRFRTQAPRTTRPSRSCSASRARTSSRACALRPTRASRTMGSRSGSEGSRRRGGTRSGWARNCRCAPGYVL